MEMSAEDNMTPPNFETVEEANKYWENRFLIMRCKFEDIGQQIIALTNEATTRPASLPTPAVVSFDLNIHETYSLDPLHFNNICEDIQGLLMQHFSGKDLLVMSEVSKDWNKLLKPSINAKTILNLTEKLSDTEDIKAFIKEDHTFKGISIYREAFSRISASLFADTVETLKITNEEPEDKSPVNFPKLKDLCIDLTENDGSSSWIPQIRAGELEELTISNDCDPEDDYHNSLLCTRYENCADIWGRFFKSMQNLKRLDLDNCCASNILQMLDSAGIQLETVRCQKIELYRQKVFEKLKKLTLTREFPSNNIFGRFNELTTLELEDFTERSVRLFFYREEQPLPVKNSIKKLSMSFDLDEDISQNKLNAVVKDLLKACPELETFFITKLTSEVMRFIACTNLKLKSLKFDRDEEGTLEVYEKMRLGINRDIQLNI